MIKASRPKLKPTTIALIFAVLIIVLGIAMIVPKYIAKNAQPLTVAEVTTAGTINLFFDPPQVSTTPNSTIDLTLKIDAGTSKATGADVALNYDPSALTVVSVTRGNFFTQSIEDAKIVSGKVTFTYHSPLVEPPTNGGKSGSGVLATIKVKPLKAGSTTLSFDQSTLATVLNVQSNSIKSHSSVVVNSLGRSDIYPAGGDGAVNLLDYNELATNYNKTGAPGFTPADINPDGKVNILDYNMLANDYGNKY